MRKAILGFIFLIIFVPFITRAQTDYRFNARPLDKGSDLYYLGQRYYNPTIGKFTQPDPLQNFLVTPELESRTGLKLEDVLANPQRLNSYSYSLNNPVNVIDPTGESPQVSEERRGRFNQISDYIRNDDSYWLTRDRDGNAAALDAIWQKSMDLSKNDKGEVSLGNALDTFYDAVHIDWAHDQVLDESEEDFRNRFANLPTNLVGQWGGDKSNIDKLQHFVASARLTYKYGPRIAGLLGRLKEVHDGFKALFNNKYSGYKALKQADEGYSQRDVVADQVGIFWWQEWRSGQASPSDVINNLH